MSGNVAVLCLCWGLGTASHQWGNRSETSFTRSSVHLSPLEGGSGLSRSRSIDLDSVETIATAPCSHGHCSRRIPAGDELFAVPAIKLFPGRWSGGLRSSPERDAVSRYEFESKHMGTTFRLVLYASSAATARQAADAAFARVAQLDGIMSDYRQTSELMRLCRQFAKEVVAPVKVSDDLYMVLEKADEMSRLSDGAFDVTVGPLVQLWRLARRTQELPDPEEFASARKRVGYQKVKLDPVRKTVQLTTPGTQLDLGGIAKGYSADEVLRLLKEQFGIHQALVGAYGDIACGDAPPGQEAWSVEIAPIASGQKSRTVKLANAAVSTSGDLEQFVVIGGVRYSHVLDPRTGLGLTGQRSVTVIAPRGITADSMTKAVSVLPPDQAFRLVEETPGAAAYVVILDKDGRPVTTASRRFAQFESQK